MTARRRSTTPAAVGLGEYVERTVRVAPLMTRAQKETLAALLTRRARTP